MKDTSTHGYLDMDLLRFTTAGSVDDGKSPLISRLLFDTKTILADTLNAILVLTHGRLTESAQKANFAATALP